LGSGNSGYYQYNYTIRAPNIRVWGWSDNGKIAYTKTDYLTDRGGSITKAIIFDLVSDLSLWEKYIDTDDYEDENQFNVAYGDFINEFKPILEQYQIKIMQTDLKSLPVIHDGNRINIIVNPVLTRGWNDAKDEDYGRKYERFTVVAERDEKRKDIYNQNNPGQSIRTVVPIGYFLSPFEDRALVVLATFTYTIREDTDVEIIFIGCHLVNGFE